MKSILDIVNRTATPAPWAEGDNIPWDDPAFSERMLAEHLSQEHDLASRRSELIDEHVEWIFSNILGGRPSRVLDLACGPGLYAMRLARRGCECVGIDFSPASIRHARESAASEPQLECTFQHADLRGTELGDGYDLVMMIYGQLNVFPRARAAQILHRAHAALQPGGALLLEIQSREHVEKEAGNGPSWYSARSGLFSARPHLVLQESFWDEQAAASTIRFVVIDAATAVVRSFALSNEAYTQQELADVLVQAGFSNLERFPSLTGEPIAEGPDLPVVVARR